MEAKYKETGKSSYTQKKKNTKLLCNLGVFYMAVNAVTSYLKRFVATAMWIYERMLRSPEKDNVSNDKV